MSMLPAKVTIEDVGLPVLGRGRSRRHHRFRYVLCRSKGRWRAAAGSRLGCPWRTTASLSGQRDRRRAGFAEEKPEAVRGFLRAYTRALKDTVRDPASALEVLLRHTEGLNKIANWSDCVWRSATTSSRGRANGFWPHRSGALRSRDRSDRACLSLQGEGQRRRSLRSVVPHERHFGNAASGEFVKHHALEVPGHISMLCVQPASMPFKQAAAYSTIAAPRVCTVSLVLAFSSAKVTMVNPSMMGLPASSSAMLVKTSRSGATIFAKSHLPSDISLHPDYACGCEIAPPMRVSQTGLVKPCGPHHCAKCIASRHASNTSARGASKTPRDRHLSLGRQRLCVLLLLYALRSIFFRAVACPPHTRKDV